MSSPSTSLLIGVFSCADSSSPIPFFFLDHLFFFSFPLEVVLRLTLSLGTASKLRDSEWILGTKKICEKSFALLLGFCWVLLAKIAAANAGTSVDVALGKRHVLTLDLFLPAPSFGKGEIGDGTTEGASFANWQQIRWLGGGKHRGAEQEQGVCSGSRGPAQTPLHRVPLVLFRWKMLLLCVGRTRSNFHFASQQQTSMLVCVRWLDLFWLMFARFFYYILK